jgi:hypothetical protein
VQLRLAASEALQVEAERKSHSLVRRRLVTVAAAGIGEGECLREALAGSDLAGEDDDAGRAGGSSRTNWRGTARVGPQLTWAEDLDASSLVQVPLNGKV